MSGHVCLVCRTASALRYTHPKLPSSLPIRSRTFSTSIRRADKIPNPRTNTTHNQLDKAQENAEGSSSAIGGATLSSGQDVANDTPSLVHPTTQGREEMRQWKKSKKLIRKVKVEGFPEQTQSPTIGLVPDLTRKAGSSISMRSVLDRGLLSPSQEEAKPLAKTTKQEKPKVYSFLPKQSWSVKSLIPPSSGMSTNEVTPDQLNHLLRLSALPQAQPGAETEKKLQELHAQLYFLRDVQKVDTAGIEPLTSILDESEEGIEETTINLEDMEDYLRDEKYVGKTQRPKRVQKPISSESSLNVKQDIQHARKVGPYFVVDNTDTATVAKVEE